GSRGAISRTLAGMGNFRGVLNKIRLVIFVVFGLPCLIFLGVTAAYKWWSGTGTVRVQAPDGESASVAIDRAAAEPVFAGQTLRRTLSQGMHHVDVTTPEGVRSYDVRISNGFQDELLPATASQCWVEYDVYDVYYAPTEGPASVKSRHGAEEPFDV